MRFTRRVLVPGVAAAAGLLVGGLLAFGATQAVGVGGDVEVSPVELRCSGDDDALRPLEFTLGEPGYTVVFRPDPGVRPTVCQLELRVTNRGGRPFTVEHLDLSAAGRAGGGPWTVAKADADLWMSAVDRDGEDAELRVDETLAAGDETTLYASFRQDSASCWAAGSGASADAEIVVSRWSVETRRPLPFTVTWRTDREVVGTSCPD